MCQELRWNLKFLTLAKDELIRRDEFTSVSRIAAPGSMEFDLIMNRLRDKWIDTLSARDRLWMIDASESQQFGTRNQNP